MAPPRMTGERRRRRHLAAGAVCALVAGGALVTGVTPGSAATSPNPLPGWAQLDTHQRSAVSPHAARDGAGGDEGDSLEVADRAEQYANERSAPAETVSAAALLAARTAAAAMPSSAAVVHEVTTMPMQADPAGYTDPYWSNAGSGFGLVSGRVTALAVDGSTTYAGAADGGMWRSTDNGRSWSPLWQNAPSLSIGAATVDRSHALWVGTGEANTNSDSYRGVGVYISRNQGASFARVGGTELLNRQVYRLRASENGWMYAATSQGLYRHRMASTSGAWQLVLKPDPNPTGSPYLTSFITDVVIKPGSHGKDVTAVSGWRNGSAYNGFYRSVSGGGAGSFAAITPTGSIDTTDIGRTTMEYAADGSRLYAIIESPNDLLSGAATVLQGVFLSANGDPAGPWTTIATSQSLGDSGSALQNLPGYNVGIQAWYNQALAVDPKNPKHVYVSLEEVFESTNGGRTFTTASPYWNYGLVCGATCPRTTHPDQHALAITAGGEVVIGNDGGVYRRPLAATGYGHWTNLNTGLRTLQYYDARQGLLPGGTTAFWGGLQDNGTSLVKVAANRNIEPAGGDGGMVIVNPRNAQQAVGEYTDLLMYRTSDGGHSFTNISPVCGNDYTGADCDVSARFIAPYVADIHDVNHWVAGGSSIWDTRRGWATTCAGATCDWVNVHSLGNDASGAPNLATALATSGVTTYAGWVGGGGNPGPAFASGIDTNYAGSWHRIASPVLPGRYLSALTIDPANPAHVYAVYNGYSRRWIPGGGLGVVFESRDGGSTWLNVSGNLPDAPGSGLAIVGKTLVLGTDVGAFTASTAKPTRWSKVAGVPNTAVNNVTPTANGQGATLATHGRGIWRLALP